RRCVDLAELLAAAATGQARAVVLSADLRHLDGEALAGLAATGLAVVGLTTPGDAAAEQRLRRLGVPEVLPADADAADVSAAVLRAVAHVEERRSAGGRDRVARTNLDRSDPATALAHRPVTREPSASVPCPGRVVAVWGPTGAPGRTTVAVN